MCILSVYTLLKVVGYYDLSVLSKSVMVFQKKFGWGVGAYLGGVSSIQICFGIFEIVLTLQSRLYNACKTIPHTKIYKYMCNTKSLFV